MEDIYLDRRLVILDCLHEWTAEDGGRIICLDCGEQLYPVMADPDFGTAAWFDALPEMKI